MLCVQITRHAIHVDICRDSGGEFSPSVTLSFFASAQTLRLKDHLLLDHPPLGDHSPSWDTWDNTFGVSCSPPCLGKYCFPGASSCRGAPDGGVWCSSVHMHTSALTTPDLPPASGNCSLSGHPVQLKEKGSSLKTVPKRSHGGLCLPPVTIEYLQGTAF